MRDTPPEINAMIFQAMMRRTHEERFLMGMAMTSTARAMAWASLTEDTETAKRAAFLRRIYGDELTQEEIHKVASAFGSKPQTDLLTEV